jgi:hypothetical protein
MPTLLRFLEDRDAGYLRIVAELAGLELPEIPREKLAGWLADALIEEDQLQEQLDSLSPDAQAALDHLLQHGGQVPFADFSRQFGPMREFGPARRDRELIWRDPISPLEELWYQAYIGRAFLDTAAGPQEFAFIPDEIFTALGAPDVRPEPAAGRPATQPTRLQAATSALVDDATTLLALLRRHSGEKSIQPDSFSSLELHHLRFRTAIPLLVTLLGELKIFDSNARSLQPDAAREFLQSDRPAALRQLLLAWLDSPNWNDLAAVPGLHSSKGGWPNDPLLTRAAVLQFLADVPPGVWWDFASFLEDIRREHPGFQRPAGDFDSWYFQDDEGQILHGIEAWDQVEGAMLRALLERTLHWLGAIDLGFDHPDAPAVAFRLTPASPLLFGKPAAIEIQAPAGGVEISSRGRLRFARSAPRALRYQIARFADWNASEEGSYSYSLSPKALQRARDQGLQVNQIRSLLEETGAEIPPSLTDALDRFAAQGIEAQIERLCLLRTESPAVMDELRENRSTRRFIKEVLGPQIARVEEGQVPRLLEAALQAGIFLDSFSIGNAEEE